MSDLKIEDYLKGCIAYDIGDRGLTPILYDRNVAEGTLVKDLDRKTLDLCKADLYWWCATAPSVTQRVKDADGQWLHEEGGREIGVTDKRALRQMANEIYARYGEHVRKNKVKIIGFGVGWLTQDSQTK